MQAITYTLKIKSINIFYSIIFIDSFRILYHEPKYCSLPSPSIFVPHSYNISLKRNPPKLIKSKTEWTNKHLASPSFQYLIIHPHGTGSYGLSHSIPFYLTNLTCKMFIAMSHWSSSRTLTHDHHKALTETSIRYRAVALTHEVPVAIFPQDQFFHAFQQANDEVDVSRC